MKIGLNQVRIVHLSCIHTTRQEFYKAYRVLILKIEIFRSAIFPPRISTFFIHDLIVFAYSAAQCAVQQQRGMANLKAIAIRLKSVKNIQKITQSMKMVSAAKYARAERDLKAARPYGNGAQAFYSGAQIGRDEEGNLKPVEGEGGQAPKTLYVALTSDRGLCGAIHSSICKTIRNELLEKPNLDNVGIICVGDKSRAQLGR